MKSSAIDIGGIRALRFTVSERAMWLEDEKTGERIRIGDKPSSAGHLAGMLLGDVLARADAWLVLNGTSGLGALLDEYNQNIIAPWKAEMELLIAARDAAIDGRYANANALRESMKKVEELRAENAKLNKEIEEMRPKLEKLSGWLRWDEK